MNIKLLRNGDAKDQGPNLMGILWLASLSEQYFTKQKKCVPINFMKQHSCVHAISYEWFKIKDNPYACTQTHIVSHKGIPQGL
jgi:hypothetical protein